MDGVLIDNLYLLFSFVFYFSLIVVYLLRAHELEEQEMKLGLVFSMQLIPFSFLWVLNLLFFHELGRIISGLPIILFLSYDLWYRLITRRKPVHHPDRWPIGLVVYLILLLIGCIGVNWYGYILSDFNGRMLVGAFFVMMSAFGYYQYRYSKSRKIKLNPE
jgi:hypothetical protein